MEKIIIKRYEPESAGYQGTIEPEDKSWILYVGKDGAPLFYPHRHEDGGVACQGVGRHNTPHVFHDLPTIENVSDDLLQEAIAEANRVAVAVEHDHNPSNVREVLNGFAQHCATHPFNPWHWFIFCYVRSAQAAGRP